MQGIEKPLYALSNLAEGESPSWRMIRDPKDATGGEVVMEEPPPPGWVWDASAQALREPTDTERLEEAKAHKIDEFAKRAIDDLAAHFTGEHGRDETMQLLTDTVVRLCQQAGVQYDPRLDEIRAVAVKAYQKKAAIEGAQSPEELEGIAW